MFNYLHSADVRLRFSVAIAGLDRYLDGLPDNLVEAQQTAGFRLRGSGRYRRDEKGAAYGREAQSNG